VRIQKHLGVDGRFWSP